MSEEEQTQCTGNCKWVNRWCDDICLTCGAYNDHTPIEGNDAYDEPNNIH